MRSRKYNKGKSRRLKNAQRKHAIKARRKREITAKRNYIKNAAKKRKNSRLRSTAKYKRHTIIIPTDFSLITNKEKVLQFYNDCKRLNYEKEKYTHVLFDFTDVINISHGAIAILLSIIGWFQDQNMKAIGTYPKDLYAKGIFEESGFLEYCKGKVTKKCSDNVILQRGHEHTDSNLTAIYIRKAMKTVWGEAYRNQKMQGMLIEMMANTINHAYKRHQKGWYFAVQHIPEEKKVKFSFVDNGRGILKTIKTRFKDKLTKVLGFTDDTKILSEAFEGKFGSRTKLTYRGRGLPVMKKNFEQGVIKNLKVISNNVFIDFETKDAQILKEYFEGTYYYWELDTTCKLWPLK